MASESIAHGHAVAHGEVAHGHDGHHGALQHQFDDLDQQRESFSLGMWLFLATEVMMFGGLFFAYSLYRTVVPGAFQAGSEHMNLFLGTINTFVLLASSYTMARAVMAAAEQKRSAVVRFLGVTLVFGLMFLVIKYFEWKHDWDIGLIPGLNWTFYDNPHNAHEAAKLGEHGVQSHNVLMFFTIYFCMTGLHAIHMIIGIALVGYFMHLARRGHFENGNDQPVEILGLYWHLVDIIWIFLFPLLYLIAGFDFQRFFGGIQTLIGGGGH